MLFSHKWVFKIYRHLKCQAVDTVTTGLNLTVIAAQGFSGERRGENDTETKQSDQNVYFQFSTRVQ